jgi:hypothetical protein
VRIQDVFRRSDGSCDRCRIAHVKLDDIKLSLRRGL